MLVLTIKDGERIALFNEIHDEMMLLGWIKFHSGREPQPVGRPSIKSPCWELQDPQGNTEAYVSIPGDVVVSAGTVNWRIGTDTTPHGRFQWQVKFNAPREIKLLREKVIKKAQATETAHGPQPTK